jgi:hypothetical protein
MQKFSLHPRFQRSRSIAPKLWRLRLVAVFTRVATVTPSGWYSGCRRKDTGVFGYFMPVPTLQFYHASYLFPCLMRRIWQKRSIPICKERRLGSPPPNEDLNSDPLYLRGKLVQTDGIRLDTISINKMCIERSAIPHIIRCILFVYSFHLFYHSLLQYRT